MALIKTRTQLLQSDSRGRIVLPKELKHHKLFELEPDALSPDHFHLFPLETRRRSAVAEDSLLKNETRVQLVKRILFSRFVEFAKNKKVESLVLYGSYARGDAFNTSDLDIAIFLKSYPTFKQRREIQDELDLFLKEELALLERNKIDAEISLLFITMQSKSSVSPLVFSIASDGIVIWQKQKIFDDWKSEVMKTMKRLHVISKGEGKSRTWIWKNND